jgi:hypothetical protein
MKKYFLSVAIIIGGLSQTQAQVVMGGPEVGLNISTLSQKVNGNKVSNEMLPGLKIGGVLDIGVTHHFSIQPGVFYSMKGYKNDYTRTVVLNNLTYTRYDKQEVTLSYLEVPINFLYKSSLYSGGRFFIGGGPYVAAAIGGKVKIESERVLTNNGDGTRIKETSERSISTGSSAANDDIKPADVGLNLTGGYEFGNGIFLRANAAMGLVNIQPGGDDNNSLRNLTVGLSVGYMFGK